MRPLRVTKAGSGSCLSRPGRRRRCERSPGVTWPGSRSGGTSSQRGRGAPRCSRTWRTRPGWGGGTSTTARGSCSGMPHRCGRDWKRWRPGTRRRVGRASPIPMRSQRPGRGTVRRGRSPGRTKRGSRWTSRGCSGRRSGDESRCPDTRSSDSASGSSREGRGRSRERDRAHRQPLTRLAPAAYRWRRNSEITMRSVSRWPQQKSA